MRARSLTSQDDGEQRISAQNAEGHRSFRAQGGHQLARGTGLLAIDRNDEIAGPKAVSPRRAAGFHRDDRNRLGPAIAPGIADGESVDLREPFALTAGGRSQRLY